MCWRSRAERARRPRLGRVRPAGIELDHPLPRLDRLVELPLPRERGALVVERAGVLGIEPQHPLERLERLGGAAVLEQRAAQRRERLQLVRVGLEQPHQHRRSPRAGVSVRRSRSASASAAAP